MASAVDFSQAAVRATAMEVGEAKVAYLIYFCKGFIIYVNSKSDNKALFIKVHYFCYRYNQGGLYKLPPP